MDYSINKIRNDEKGFTLVELAVVMIIIGLLIGGILKGQELITNARITSTIGQLEGINAATNDFRNQFNALPGDMATASIRLDCGPLAAVCTDGDGSGRLNVAAGTAIAANDEAENFFINLVAANYITGMDASANGGGFGVSLPTAAVGGGYTVGFHAGGAANGLPVGRQGTYVVLIGNNVAVAANAGIVNTVQAASMDRRLDDGNANSGTILGDTANCVAAAAAGLSYAENNPEQDCSIAYRL